ncbi:MAG: potassium channel family protein [Muribaculaceae bacterium]|nr:potassium channel family protein [Muribaculaceae bacterium]
MTFSDRIRHFFHVISNVRPIVWICLYIGLTPVFALIYWALPDGQFRIPDGGGVDYGSWLYYSIVTITTLGFGDYTPAHGWAQAVTAVEVMCGLTILGFFLNAVGSMKSEIDVTAEIEKQRRLHEASMKDKLMKSIPALMHNLNNFLTYCYAATTPLAMRDKTEPKYNPNFSIDDMADIYKPSGLSIDRTQNPAVERLMKAAQQTSLALDSLQTRVDLTQWPDLLEDCFTFVADCQMFTENDIPAEDKVKENADATPHPLLSLSNFIKDNAALARKIETELTKIASAE